MLIIQAKAALLRLKDLYAEAQEAQKLREPRQKLKPVNQGNLAAATIILLQGVITQEAVTVPAKVKVLLPTTVPEEEDKINTLFRYYRI
jgi:hypothetical protein